MKSISLLVILVLFPASSFARPPSSHSSASSKGRGAVSPPPIERTVEAVLGDRELRYSRILNVTRLVGGQLAVIAAAEKFQGGEVNDQKVYLVIFDPKQNSASAIEVAKPALRGFSPTKAVMGPDGSIYIAGSYISAEKKGKPDFDVFVMKLKPDGNLDPTFGNEGIMSIDAGAMNDDAGAIALHGDALLVGVDAWSDGPGSRVYRLTPQGKLDTTYGQGLWTAQGFRDVVAGSKQQDTHLSLLIPKPDGSVTALVSKGGMAGTREYMNFFRTEVVKREKFQNPSILHLIELNPQGKIVKQTQQPVDRNFMATQSIQLPSGEIFVLDTIRAPGLSDPKPRGVKIFPSGEMEIQPVELPNSGSLGRGTADGTGEGTLFPRLDKTGLSLFRLDATGKRDRTFGNTDGLTTGELGLLRLDAGVNETSVSPRLVKDAEGDGYRLLSFQQKNGELYLSLTPVNLPKKAAGPATMSK